jgi:DNA-binding CsgD family transcriptional regulator
MSSLDGANRGPVLLRARARSLRLPAWDLHGWSMPELAAVAGVIVIAGLGLSSKVIQGGHSSLDIALDVLNGAVLVGCALMLRRRRVQPWLMRLLLLAAALWFAEDLVISQVAPLFALGAVFENGFDPVVVHMLLAYPTGRLRTRLERRLVALAYVGSLGPGAVRALVYYVSPHPCPGSCPRDALPGTAVFHAPWTYGAAQHLQDGIGAAVAVIGLAILIQRHLESSSAARRRMQVLAGAIPVIALIYAVGLARSSTGPWPEPWYSITSISSMVTALLFPVCIVLGVLRADSLRARVAELALSRPDTPAAEAGLRELLADPGLRILPAGDPGVKGPASQGEAAPLVIDGSHVGTLMHDPVLSFDPGLLTIVTSTAATALTHGERTVDPGSLEAVARLSSREREVLELMADGLSNQVIARRLGISFKTVEKHVASVFTKLDLPAEAHLNRRVAAVVSFMRAGC